MARKGRNEFQLPPPPIEHVTLTKRVMHEIRDRAHKIWQERKRPDANLIMFQALKDYMESKGCKANFSIDYGKDGTNVD